MLLQIIQYTTNFETKMERRFNNKVNIKIITTKALYY